MNYQKVIFEPESQEQLLESSSSPFKLELLQVVANARKVVLANQFDESDDVFLALIDDVFHLACSTDINSQIKILDDMSELFADAMHRSNGFSFNEGSGDILDQISADPTLLGCYLIQWACEMLSCNSSSFEQFYKIKLLSSQLNWLSASKQLLYYSEDRFISEDKNRTKTKPEYDYGYHVVARLINKGVEFKELKLASNAIVCLLKLALEKFIGQLPLTKSEMLAFTTNRFSYDDSESLLSKAALIDKYEDKWNKQFGENNWRLEKTSSIRWGLFTASELQDFLMSKSPENKMSSALRDRFTFNFKAGNRPKIVLDATADALCREFKLSYNERTKKFSKF